jgi:type II secretory pathway pseudopilin PulG
MGGGETRSGNMQRRQGFTLVEMLVATALVIFIMVIVTEAFTTGMDTFRQLKTIGDLEAKLRGATAILRKDLAADHFDSSQRLRDPNFWANGPPSGGFFRIWQGTTPTAPEGTDGDGITSYYATNHALHFTVKRQGNRRDAFASAAVPPGSPLLALGQPTSTFHDSANTYSSHWYEVAYFMVDSGDQTPGGVHRFTLFRRQRVVVPDNSAVNWNAASQVQATPANLAAYAEVSCMTNPNGNGMIYFNTPKDLTVPERRFGMIQNQSGGVPQNTGVTNGTITQLGNYPILTDTNGSPIGSDILLTDVISFSVRILYAGQNDFIDVVPSTTNSLFPGTNAASPALPVAVFDTWSSVNDGTYNYSNWATGGNLTSLPPVTTTQILALQITIRVWDQKTKLTRQVTLVQDM